MEDNHQKEMSHDDNVQLKKKRVKNARVIFLIVAACFALLLAIEPTKPEKVEKKQSVKTSGQPTTVAEQEDLGNLQYLTRALLVEKLNAYEQEKDTRDRLQTKYGDLSVEEAMPADESRSANELSGSVSNKDTIAGDTAQNDYSRTNNQVEGVDEGDIVKTDGKYIYTLSGNKVVIVDARNANRIRKVETVQLKEMSGQELFVDGDSMVVIGQEELGQPNMERIMEDSATASNNGFIWPAYEQTTKVLVFDITNRSNAKQIREMKLDGYYAAGRKVGRSVYIVSNKSFNSYDLLRPIKEDTGNIKILEEDVDILLPEYKDSAVTDSAVKILPETILAPEKVDDCSYTTVAGFHLDRPKEAADIKTILGTANGVYASERNIYTTKVSMKTGADLSNGNQYVTDIYRLAIHDAKVTMNGSGRVDGQILNQFSMDEFESCFRIATTDGEVWDTAHPSQNHVFVLDTNMKIIGSIKNLAPGESIHSVRFMGSKVFMVTYKTVDPFFVIDLSEPQNPKVLGELKIPGYSDYLHPYDANHIIGIGVDTKEIRLSDGNVTSSRVGLKIAMFDVTDYTNPKLLFEDKFGDMYADSQALYDHKAVLFSKEKSLLAFPVTMMIESGNRAGQMESCALVYNMDLEKGFSLRGKVSHNKREFDGYAFESIIQRLLYINENLYSVAEEQIQSYGLDTLKLKGKVDL